MFWSFAFPLLLTVALGLAFRNKAPDPVRAAVVASVGSEAVVAALAKNLEIKVIVLDRAQALAQLRGSKVAVVVQAGAPMQVHFDPMRPESRMANWLVNDALQRAAGRQDSATIEAQPSSEIGSRYIDFLLPGLIGMNLMSAGMWGVGYVVVEMRTRKLLKRMLATPMNRRDFLLSMVLMRLIFLVVELPVMLGFGWLAFDVRVQGSMGLFCAVALLGSLCFAGIGLLVASRAQNTQTVGGLMNLVMMPMFLGSGVFFSSANFPDAMQPVLRLLPLTALNDALRAIANESAGFTQVLPQVSLLAVLAVLAFGAAVRWFRWQ